MKTFPFSVWIFAVILAAITSLPYVVGGLSTPEGWAYSGVAVVPTGTQFDVNSHFAKMWQGSRGEWDYQLLFTHEPHPGLPMVQAFYTLLGAIAHLTPFSLPLVFHIVRFGLTVGLVLSVWSFASYFFEKTNERWFATLFGTIAVGCSWLLLFISPSMTSEVGPIEFWLIDAFNLLGAMYMPHFAAAIILQIVIVLCFETWVRNQRSKDFWVLTAALALESIVQPYAIVLFIPLLVLLTSYHLFGAKRIHWQKALWLIIPFGIHAALVLYQYVALNSDPVWASFTAQNITLSPSISYYLLGYLPFLIPVACGFRRFMLDTADDRWWIPIIWVALVAMLLYAPFPTQRRYLLGVQTPLAVMAAYGWTRAILPRLKPRRQPLVSITYFAVAVIALVGIIVANTGGLSNPTKNTTAFYQPDEVAGFEWLKQHAAVDDLILTTFDASGNGSGGKVVAATGRHVFIGHWIETANFDLKMTQLRQFYDETIPNSWRQDFLKQINARYIWYDESARAVGNWNPAVAAYLEPVFSSESINIYQVN